MALVTWSASAALRRERRLLRAVKVAGMLGLLFRTSLALHMLKHSHDTFARCARLRMSSRS